MKTNRIYSFLGILFVLTLFCGNAWGDAYTTATLDFGTPIISDNFNSLSPIETKPGSSSGSDTKSGQTAYGVFTDCYVGKANNIGYGIYEAATPFTTQYLKVFGNGSNLATMYLYNTNIKTKGAFDIYINAGSEGYFGLYAAVDNTNEFAKANTVVYFKISSNTLYISDGNTSTHTWQSVKTSLSGLTRVTAIYNVCGSAQTYNGISIDNATAHVYVDGTAIMDGANPKAFTIPTSRNPYYFRINSKYSAGLSLDDLKIYDALPTAAGDAITLNKNNSDASGSSNGSGLIVADATSLSSGFTAPTRTGYEVEGYYTTSACTTKIATAAGALQNGDGSGITVSGNVWTNSSRQWKRGADETFYTKWNPINYTITLNDGDGSGGSGTVTATFDDNNNLTSSVTVPSRKHYIFGGYYTGDNGTGTQIIDATGAFKASASDASYTYTDGSKNWKYADDIELKAKWTEHTYINYRTLCCTKYDITLASSGSKTGGTFEVDPTSACAGTEITLTASPSTGYEFTKWTITNDDDDDEDVTTTVLGSGYEDDASVDFDMPAYNITIDAAFTPQTYTINYYDGDEEDEDKTFSGEHADGYPTTHTYATATALKGATKDGYDFGGWFDNKECDGDAITSLGATDYTADITLYAKWTASGTYRVTITAPTNGTITVSWNDGEDQTLTSGYADIDVNTELTITTTPSTGYEQATLTVNEMAYSSAFELTGNITVAATFSAQTSTVTLDNNDATSGSSQTVLATYDASMPLVTTADGTPAVVAVSRTGYDFNGWWDATSDGKQYYSYTSSTIASANNWDKTGTQTLYAQWIAKEYTITLDREGAASGAESVTATYDAGTLAGWSAPTKTGYRFDGYYSGDNGTGTLVISSTGVLQNSVTISAVNWTDASGHWIKEGGATVYAKWIANEYTISYKDQGDVAYSGNATAGVPTGAPTTHTYGSATALVNGVKDGYRFDGWFDNSTCTGSAITSIGSTAITANTTYYAKWTEVYTVTWHVNGAEYSTGVVTGNSQVPDGEKISDVPTAPADNTLNNCANKFMGWSSKDAGSTAKTTSYYDDLFTTQGNSPTISGNTDFYAVFAERDGAAVNTVMWSENWTGATSGTTPTSPTASGSTVYSDATITYTWTPATGSSTGNTYLDANDYAGGSSPEAQIGKGNTTAGKLTISGIPSAGATKLTVSYKQNAQSLTASVSGPGYSGSKTSSTKAENSFDVTVGSASTFSLIFTGGSSNNVRLDNIVVKVKTVSYSNYVTECAANQVRVSYDFNGGYGTACTEGVTTKTANYTICSTTPTKSYYDFNKWNDGTSSYAAGATGYDLQSNTTFTAQWTPTTYNITYENMEGATNALVNVATYNIETATITLGTPTRGHDRFDGWYDNSSFTGGAITSIPLGSHGDITLYAKWTERHHIEFFKEGVSIGEMWRAEDENMEDAVAGQGSVPSDPSAPTACSSKTFVGWITNDDYDSDNKPTGLMKPAAGSVDADKEYHAVWATSTSGSKTLVMEITRADFDGSYHNGAEQSHTSTAVANDGSGATLSVSWKSVNVGDFSSKIQVKDVSGAGFWNTTDLGSISSVSITTGNNITHFENTSVHPTSTSGTTKGYFTVTKSGGTGTATKVTVTFTKTISYYNAYATSCCTKYDITGASTSGTAVEVNGKTGGTLTSSHNSRCAGKNVTLSAAVNTGYQFNGWTITGSTSGDDLTSLLDDATSLTPAAFTMPSEGITVSANISEQVVTAWSWTYDDDDIPNPLELYVGEKKTVNVTYTPSTIINTHKSYDHAYGAGATTYITATKAQAYCTIKGNKATNDETLTLTHVDDSSGDFAQVIHVKVTPLPVDHYLDLVHGVEFDDQAATATDGVVTLTYTAPGGAQDEWTDEYANTCEQKKVKLVGWVESEYADACIAADSFPDTATLKADSEHFFEVGATMTASNKTYYAVWAEKE